MDERVGTRWTNVSTALCGAQLETLRQLRCPRESRSAGRSEQRGTPTGTVGSVGRPVLGTPSGRHVKPQQELRRAKLAAASSQHRTVVRGESGVTADALLLAIASAAKRHIGAMPQAGVRAHSGTVQRLVGPVDLARFDSTVKVPTEGSGRTSRTQAAASCALVMRRSGRALRRKCSGWARPEARDYRAVPERH